jgi:hypothetical protein
MFQREIIAAAQENRSWDIAADDLTVDSPAFCRIDVSPHILETLYLQRVPLKT